MNKEQMETYRQLWLSEQIPLEDMNLLLKENPDLLDYFGLGGQGFKFSSSPTFASISLKELENGIKITQDLRKVKD